MKKGYIPHQSWFDAIEEEKKVKRNLSRLIHTLQHIPSDRSGNSLRDLVKEIECFNPLVTKETRSFSRSSCHNLLHDEATSSLGRLTGVRKLQIDNSKRQTAFTPNSSKSKNKKLTVDANLSEKRKLPYKDESQLNNINKCPSTSYRSNIHISKNKTKHEFNNSSAVKSPDRKQFNLNKNSPKNKVQKDFSNIKRKQDLNSKPENRQEVKTVANHLQIIKNTNASKYKKTEEFDKVTSGITKTTIAQKQQLIYSRGFEKIVNKNNKPLTTQESNKVKKLTSYWNSVLNNEMDEYKSKITTPTRSIRSIKSLELKTHSATRKNVKSENIYESDLSTIESMPKENNNDISVQTETFYKITDNEYKPSNTTSITSMCTKLSDDVKQERDLVNTDPTEIYQTRQAEIEFVIDTSEALVTLEKLQRYIKQFPNSTLLSEKICLPRSVKVMISLLTAALSADHYKQLWIEVSDCKTVQNQLKNNGEGNQIAPSFSPQQGGTGDFCPPQIETQHAVVLANKNFIQVNNALKYISLCKEVLWRMYISNPISCLNYPTGTFDFVYEETIMIDKSDSEDSESGEEEEVSIKDLIAAVANTLGELSNAVLQYFSNNWPNSIEDMMRTTYYTIMSALAWWVIVKEIWCEK